MHKLFEFIRTVYVAVLFLLFEAVALATYARSTPYTEARLLARSNRVVGGVQGVFAGVRRFCSLGSENRELLGRVAVLESELARYREAEAKERLASYLADGADKGPYTFSTARVVSNRINTPRNYLVLDRGLQDGLLRGMAVLSPGGAMVGYVVYVSKHYAVALSVLNTEFRASGKLVQGGDYFGSIEWDGADSRRLRMRELSKYADIRMGDEVVSTGFSQYFPEGILIGTVDGFELDATKTSYEVSVRLAVDMTALGDVILVRNRDLEEVQSLEAKLKNRYL